MKYFISKERFLELGLGYDITCCMDCEDCIEYNGKPHCSSRLDICIEDAQELNEICECVNIDRLHEEMTEIEYDAFRHNRLAVGIEMCKIIR